jgi:quercetin dioxygenase-like cupin family protein
MNLLASARGNVTLERALATILDRIDMESHGQVLDVFGPTVEFLRRPSSKGGGLCVLRGVIPPGITIPLHSHEDPEDFYLLAGTHQVLTQQTGGLQWVDVRAGDYVSIPPGTMHAHRNVSAQPAIDLLITTPKLGRFFEEIGRPVSSVLGPPSPEDVERFVATSIAYGYVLGTPDQNVAVGIELPPLGVE